jgi:Tripartite tricarboxylate transporter TctB family
MPHQNEGSKGEPVRSNVEGPPVVRRATVDAIVASIIAVIGAVVVVEARRLGATWTSDGPGAGYFPFYVGLILVVCGVAIVVKAIRMRGSASDEPFVDRAQLARVASVFVPSAVYVAGIMVLGLYVASALFIALFMIVLGKYSPVKSVVVGVVVCAVFFAMFEVWFKVPLYKGALNPLGFLGY